MTDPLGFILNLLQFLAGSATISVIVAAIFERRNKRAAAAKVEADYANQISQTAMALVEPLKAEVARLTNRVDVMDRKLARYSQRMIYLMGGIDQLIRQVMDLENKPVWTPDDWDPDGSREDR
jgi:polyhydroxyalkanoate synthesis regulator phasin